MAGCRCFKRQSPLPAEQRCWGSAAASAGVADHRLSLRDSGTGSVIRFPLSARSSGSSASSTAHGQQCPATFSAPLQRNLGCSFHAFHPAMGWRWPFIGTCGQSFTRSTASSKYFYPRWSLPFAPVQAHPYRSSSQSCIFEVASCQCVPSGRRYSFFHPVDIKKIDLRLAKIIIQSWHGGLWSWSAQTAPASSSA